MERYYAKKDASNSNTGNKETESRLEQKRPRIELDLRDIKDRIVDEKRAKVCHV